MEIRTFPQHEAMRLMGLDLQIQQQDAGGVWHDFPCDLCVTESSLFRVRPDETSRPRLVGDGDVFGDGCCRWVYLGEAEDWSSSVLPALQGMIDDDFGHDVLATIWLVEMTDAEAANLPEI